MHVESTSCSSSMLADLTYGTSAPGAFGKTTPANTAMGQSTSLTLDWGDASDAATYDYCLETPVNGSCTTWTTGLTASQVPVSGLLLSSSYEWQVRAVNGTGTTYADSGTLWTFTTTSVALSNHNYLPFIKKPVSPPAAFGKSSPASGASGVSTSPAFSWAASSGASSYDFCYDGSVNGDCTGGWTSTGASTSWSLSGLPNSTTYEWQVRANNSTGIPTYADGGTEWSFTTVAALPAWTIVTSENFETAIPKAGWTVNDFSDYDGGDYKMGRRACNINSGTYSGWLVGGGTNGSALACDAEYKTYNYSWFIYGPFNTTSATAGEVNFNFYVNAESGYDFFDVYATDNYSGNWYGYYWTGAFPWQAGTLDLSETMCNDGTASCLGKTGVYIAFIFESDESYQYAYGAQVDNIVLRLCNAPTCASGAPAYESTQPWLTPVIQDFLQPFLQPILQALTGFSSGKLPQ